MDVVLPSKGMYVVAVSGGVDSMALLHALHAANAADLQLVVAHLDHGIREDSAEDSQLVEQVARAYGLVFESQQAQLGVGASEAVARQARYDFLHEVKSKYNAQAIVTAHHQDDVLETAILNMIRGTGRKGLSSLQSRPDVVRPLLTVPKAALIEYAKDQGLLWREDSTNSDESYLRNYIRSRIIPQFDPASRRQLLAVIEDMAVTNQELDSLIQEQLQQQSEAGVLDRGWFNQLPHSAAREVMAGWLRTHGIREFDRAIIERLVVAAKTAQPGKQFPIIKGHFLEVKAGFLALKLAER